MCKNKNYLNRFFNVNIKNFYAAVVYTQEKKGCTAVWDLMQYDKTN